MGGGGGGPPDPEKWRGPVSKKMFLGHWASVWAKNMLGVGGGGGGSFPGYATDKNLALHGCCKIVREIVAV